ncbi:MAG: zinc-dependent peptidase [Planctomycetaceae bacterium]
MLFWWWRDRRRRRILREPFPAPWREWLEGNVAHYRRLDTLSQSRMRDLIQVFVAEKHWEGLAGLVVTDEMRVSIAAMASLLILHSSDELNFDHMPSVLIYPNYFLARNLQPDAAGVVTTTREAWLGEAWYRGPVILSWEDVLLDVRPERRGCNVAVHEFAHQLDMLNGRFVDGIPPLPDTLPLEQWEAVMGAEYRRLVRRCRRGQRGLIDCYGSQNAAEFFAVVTESFFESPLALRADAPELYTTLRQFYRLDPGNWGSD